MHWLGLTLKKASFTGPNPNEAIIVNAAAVTYFEQISVSDPKEGTIVHFGSNDSIEVRETLDDIRTTKLIS